METAFELLTLLTEKYPLEHGRHNITIKNGTLQVSLLMEDMLWHPFVIPEEEFYKSASSIFSAIVDFLEE